MRFAAGAAARRARFARNGESRRCLRGLNCALGADATADAALWYVKTSFCPQIASFCRPSALRDAHTNRILDSTGTPTMDTITYLREIAQTCTRLARTCPHQATSHGLEEIAVDLMAKAQELERQYG